MTQPDIEQQLSDGIIVCAGYVSNDKAILHTASKFDAQWLYSAVNQIAVDGTRSYEETDEEGLHRTYYLELAESDEHSLEDEEAFSWNTRAVYRVTFEPTDEFKSRMFKWADKNLSHKAPTDFKMTPTIAKIIYYAGSHEMAGSDGPYLEFDAVDSQKLDAELQNLDIQSTNVGELWRLDEENSARFRAYAGIDAPNGGETCDEEN